MRVLVLVLGFPVLPASASARAGSASAPGEGPAKAVVRAWRTVAAAGLVGGLGPAVVPGPVLADHAVRAAPVLGAPAVRVDYADLVLEPELATGVAHARESAAAALGVEHAEVETVPVPGIGLAIVEIVIERTAEAAAAAAPGVGFLALVIRAGLALGVAGSVGFVAVTGPAGSVGFVATVEIGLADSVGLAGRAGPGPLVGLVAARCA